MLLKEVPSYTTNPVLGPQVILMFAAAHPGINRSSRDAGPMRRAWMEKTSGNSHKSAPPLPARRFVRFSRIRRNATMVSYVDSISLTMRPHRSYRPN